MDSTQPGPPQLNTWWFYCGWMESGVVSLFAVVGMCCGTCFLFLLFPAFCWFSRFCCFLSKGGRKKQYVLCHHTVWVGKSSTGSHQAPAQHSARKLTFQHEASGAERRPTDALSGRNHLVVGFCISQASRKSRHRYAWVNVWDHHASLPLTE